jgi:hypothetical protein
MDQSKSSYRFFLVILFLDFFLPSLIHIRWSDISDSSSETPLLVYVREFRNGRGAAPTGSAISRFYAAGTSLPLAFRRLLDNRDKLRCSRYSYSWSQKARAPASPRRQWEVQTMNVGTLFGGVTLGKDSSGSIKLSLAGIAVRPVPTGSFLPCRVNV